MTRSQLEQKLAAGAFVVTAEITPPLSASADELLARVEPLRGLVDAVNVTDAAAARPAMSSFAAAAILVRSGIEPIAQVTCRDRNRIALAGDLLGAAAQGVVNLLILRGDDPTVGDMPQARAVFDLDSRGVMALARDMRNRGALPSGRAIRPPPHFFIGCADTPVDPPDAWTPTDLAAKIAAGAEFAQTQFLYDIGLARRYLARLRRDGILERIKVIAGIGPIGSAKAAQSMHDNLYGVTIPASILARLENAADPRAEGRAICIELIRELSEIEGVSGIHVMAPQQAPEVIAEVIRESGLPTARAAVPAGRRSARARPRGKRRARKP